MLFKNRTLSHIPPNTVSRGICMEARRGENRGRGGRSENREQIARRKENKKWEGSTLNWVPQRRQLKMRLLLTDNYNNEVGSDVWATSRCSACVKSSHHQPPPHIYLVMYTLKLESFLWKYFAYKYSVASWEHHADKQGATHTHSNSY